jgi:hypothetical protein
MGHTTRAVGPIRPGAVGFASGVQPDVDIADLDHLSVENDLLAIQEPAAARISYSPAPSDHDRGLVIGGDRFEKFFGVPPSTAAPANPITDGSNWIAPTNMAMIHDGHTGDDKLA